MNQKIKFGTDGWRARIAEDYTFNNLRRCTQGFANYLIQSNKSGEPVVIGYDMRFHSENFAAAAAEVLAANGFKVLLTDKATPTPVISYSVLPHHAVGAVNITASHNPPWDNGFKVRDENGGAIPPEDLITIESLIPDSIDDVKQVPMQEGIEKGSIKLFNPDPAYVEQLNSLIDMNPIRNAGLNIAVDPMWGNGAGWFTKLLSGGTTRITEIHNSRHPLFPEMTRPEPIPPNIDAGLEMTKKTGADVLIINDGDADRLGIGDENGNFIDQLRVFGLLAYYLLEVRGKRGPIVKTLSTTTMLDKLGKIYAVPVHHTGVGFKYIAPKMLETDAMIGGEESGGYAFQNHVPERDGILAGLYFLDMMVKLQMKPSELLDRLFEVVGSHYYKRIDTPFRGDRKSQEQMLIEAQPERIGTLEVTEKITTDGYKFSLEDGGWLLVRFSGTEPIIRVYTETTHPDLVDDILSDGLRLAGINL